MTVAGLKQRRWKLLKLLRRREAGRSLSVKAESYQIQLLRQRLVEQQQLRVKEQRLRQVKLPAAQAYVRANRLDHVILPSPKPRVGIIVTGQAARDVFEALAALGIDAQEAGRLGLAVYKVAMPWPLEPEGVRQVVAAAEIERQAATS